MTLFSDIVLIDFSRPLRERLASRKHAGPYHWTPSEKQGEGRGFYQGKGLVMDRAGSSFALRLELANDSLRGSRLALTNGYYCDEHQDSTMTPIIARLPRSRGFLAGWTMGAGMCAALDFGIYETAEDAARAAHSKADHDAEKERAYQEEERAKFEEEEKAAIAKEELGTVHRHLGAIFPAYTTGDDLDECESVPELLRLIADRIEEDTEE